MSLTRCLIVPDTHCPYHDRRAWRLMMKAMGDFKPQLIVTIGDLMDCYSVSSHSKSPDRALHLPHEVKRTCDLLDELDALGAGRKIFIGGNHEDRLYRFLNDKAPELFGLVSIPQLLQLPTRKWEYVPYKSHVRVGKVYFTHDVGSAGRNSTFKALDMYQHSVVIGHSHRLQYIVEGNAVGELKLAAQFGMLADRAQIDYQARGKVFKDCALGFGTGVIDTTTGIGYLTPVPIISYTCCVGGTVYRA